MAIKLAGQIDSLDGACLLRVGWIKRDAAVSFRMNLGPKGGVSVEIPEPITEQTMKEMLSWTPDTILRVTIEEDK